MGKLIDRLKKRLYEWSKPQIEPLNIIHTNVELKQYTACYRVNRHELDNSFLPPDVMQREVERTIINKLYEAIVRNIETEKDYYREDIVYRVNIWLKK